MIDRDRIKYLQGRIARNDDQYAYKVLFTELYAYLYHFAFSYVKSKPLAEEILSDVFIKIWEKRKELEKIDNLKLYLYVATRNTSLNYSAKQKRNNESAIDESMGEIKSLYLDPEQLLITAEMMTRIQNAINALPPKCKLVFKLVKEDGLKYKEVAEIMNISVKTVENHLAIALKKIGLAVDFDIKRTIPVSVKP